MEDIVKEILLRLPPEEPAYLIHAALVCKSWRRVLSDAGFPRRYREFHRTPPLLGYFLNLSYNAPGTVPRFVPTTSAASPFTPPVFAHWWALDCRHGRVLIRTFDTRGLIVWDPVTGDQHQLLGQTHLNTDDTGAVLCAVDGCDHLGCHGGPFRVVLVRKSYTGMSARVYSSETLEWSSQACIDSVNLYGKPRVNPSLLIKDALYFTLEPGFRVLKYDLSRHSLSVIKAPRGIQTMMVEYNQDGGLGFLAVLDDNLCMLSRFSSTADGMTGWILQWALELAPLFPDHHSSSPREVVGLVEGTDKTFINSNGGMFAVDLKSRQAKKVGDEEAMYNVLSFTSFYIPDLAKGRPSLP
ncbi:hypothetical protein EJB05_14199, partial [Eragrostis curvula]